LASEAKAEAVGVASETAPTWEDAAGMASEAEAVLAWEEVGD
jgi:hypothetical protein